METLWSAALFGAVSATTVMLERRVRSKAGTKHMTPEETESRHILLRHLSNSSKWSNYSEDLEEFIRDLPKVELHVHLDGSFDPNVLWEFLQPSPDAAAAQCFPVSMTPPWEPSTTLPLREHVSACSSPRDYHELCTCRGQYSLSAMMNRFQYFLPLVQSHLDRIERLAFDFCARQREQHVVYTEVRYSPHLLLSESDATVTADDVVQAVTRGLRRGCATYHVTVQQILCAISWRPEWALPTLELALAYRENDGSSTHSCGFVVGVDIAAGEEHFLQDGNSNDNLIMAQRAHAAGIPITLHAGEVPEGGAQHIQQAVLQYHAQRIGHGYRMVDDDSDANAVTVQLVKDHQVHVEVCPTSSVETGGWKFEGQRQRGKNWKEHPAVAMHRAGMSVSLNSDDPAVFHTSLGWQYRIAMAKMGFSKADLVRMNLEAIAASFCKETMKEEMRKRLKAFARLRAPGWSSDGRDDNDMPSPKPHEGFMDRVYIGHADGEVYT